ncbi:MAG TPA: gamma-glutamylcyclotransferase family protein [Chthoniobacterales bacterium]|jgi:gamma-glutamyl AIG2-like cyclotransferase|nr:gamma-glutamylcyclotransferase family protein [Chthoniobacterales bacterium]
MAARRLDVFFYGLFMDQDLLRAKGVQPTFLRSALVEGFALRIGERASLVPDESGRVHGVVMSLSHDELEKLYSEPSVRAYRPEAVLERLGNDEIIAALCFNLPQPPSPAERNPEYAAKLRVVAQRIGLPVDYVASIR